MAVYLTIMLLKPLDILQRVSKGQKAYQISNKKKKQMKKLNFKRFFLPKNAFSVFVVIKITIFFK